jgi:predicted transcriptional regulator of viral defense system
LYHSAEMEARKERQQDRAITLLSERGMARLSELMEAGVTAAAVTRLERKGVIVRLARGLYQLPDAPLDANHSLAEAAKLVPKGIVCLDSALAFHGLTDRLPYSIWMAVGFGDWRPRISRPPIQTIRFGPNVLNSGYTTHFIEGIPVRIYDPAKSVVDMFRVGNLAKRSAGPSRNQAIEGMRKSLHQHKATPGEIARFAEEADVWELVSPYLEALAADA